MLAVPEATPDNTPVDELIVAIETFPLVQVPPVVASVNVMIAEAQTWELPPIGDGTGFTVTVEVPVL